MTEHIGNWMLTYTGRRFYPIDPRPEDVCTEDIAHALSRICRFAGNTYCFYSVAEHSLSDTQIIKDTDAVVTESEIRQLMRCEGTDWANFVSGKDVELLGGSSEEAEYGFLDCFHKLMEDIEEVKK